ncbi:MAG: enolase C-terminal domain-like protein [Solirubrobacteraceae bacterium]
MSVPRELVSTSVIAEQEHRITAVEAIPVALPMLRPAQFASGTIDTAYNVVVRVHSDAGVVGCAEAQPRPYTYGETQESIVRTVREWFAPRLIGVDPIAYERVRALGAGLQGQNCARAAIEVAVADLSARLLGVSCATLLGGAVDQVPVAAMVSFGAPNEMAEQAAEFRDRQGIETFKVKVGREVDLDVRCVAAVRGVVPAARLYVDANRGWTLGQARAAAPRLVELGVEAIEEPISLDDIEGRLALADEWAVLVGGDESCLSLTDVAREIAGPVGQVSIKVARTAFAESREILAHCRAAGVGAVVGSQYEGALGAWASIAFAAGCPDLSARPVEAANFLDLASDLVAGPQIHEGRVAVPDAPGLGVTVDLEALDHYRLEA